jgi:hypothetical protein
MSAIDLIVAALREHRVAGSLRRVPPRKAAPVARRRNARLLGRLYLDCKDARLQLS